MPDIPIDEELAALVARATPDWRIYSEPEVGLPPGLFAGKPAISGFGPIEPLHGADLELAALAPTLAAEVLASHKREAELREDFRHYRADAEAENARLRAAGEGLEARLERASQRFPWTDYDDAALTTWRNTVGEKEAAGTVEGPLPRTRAVVEAELAKVNAKIDAAPGWGASLAALLEWRRDLKHELRRMEPQK